MNRLVILCSLLLSAAMTLFGQSFTETFDANSLAWTESAGVEKRGKAIIDKGVMTVKCNVEGSFFETHCYAPLDVRKPFEVVANVKIDDMEDDCGCGFIFNFRDNGNFYAFNMREHRVSFERVVDGEVVGAISTGARWKRNNRLNQEWKIVYDGDQLKFYVDGEPYLNIRYMPMDFSGMGFYVLSDNELVVDEVTFTQE